MEEELSKKRLYKKDGHSWNRGKKGLQVPWNKGLKGVQVGWNKGLKGVYSDEARNKMRNSRLGKKQSPETIQKVIMSKLGKKQSEETKRKRSTSMAGSKCYNWKGGITNSNIAIRNKIEYRLWRESVYARDNWTCQKYKIKGGKLHPHHLQNFADPAKQPSIIDTDTTGISGSPELTALIKDDELTMDVDTNDGSPAKLSVYVRCLK